MARDILSEYGPDTHKPQASRMSKNGPAESGSCSYSPPKGPIGIGHSGPGLGGTNYGNAGTQGTQRETHSESREAERYRGSRPMRHEDEESGGEY